MTKYLGKLSASEKESLQRLSTKTIKPKDRIEKASPARDLPLRGDKSLPR